MIYNVHVHVHMCTMYMYMCVNCMSVHIYIYVFELRNLYCIYVIMYYRIMYVNYVCTCMYIYIRTYLYVCVCVCVEGYRNIEPTVGSYFHHFCAAPYIQFSFNLPDIH